MSISQKGMVSAVIATIVASAMILFSGSGIAENKNQVKAGPKSNSEKTAVDTIKQSIAVQSGVESIQKTRVSLAPPPGPFMNGSILLENSQQIKKSFISRKAPTFTKEKPSQKVGSPLFSGQAPVLRAAPNIKKAPMPTSPQKINQKAMVSSSNAPIWSANSNNSNLALGYPIQQYMYVPVPMMPPSIMVPQAPVFNRISAPLPSFRVHTPASSGSLMQDKQNSLPKKKDKN